MPPPPNVATPSSSPIARSRYSWWLATLVIGAASVWIVAQKKSPEAPSHSLSPQPTTTARANTPPVMTAMQDWDKHWTLWLARLSTPGDDANFATDFEHLVDANPSLALARARLEPDPARRNSLVLTILLLWSESDADAAAAAARTLPDSERAAGVAAVFAGAARQPENALRLAVAICRDDPALAFDHGNSLISALSRTGEFHTAVRFALGATGNPADEDRNKWLKNAFAQWAAEKPADALAALQALPTTGPRFEALDAITSARLRTDPAGVAETLRLLPPGPDRNLALSQALRTWIARDPKTAADWLDRHEPSPDLDAGAATLATQPQILAQRPAVALSWAESIVNPDLRSRTLATVVEKWAASQPDAALAYARNSPDLLPADRTPLIATLTTPPPTTP